MSAFRLLSAGLFFYSAALVGCSGSSPPGAGPQAGGSDSPAGKPAPAQAAGPVADGSNARGSPQVDERVDRVAREAFDEVKARMVQDAGVGGPEIASDLRRDSPVSFSVIPNVKLLQDQAPGGAEDLVASLTSPDETKVVYPIKRGDRVVSSLVLGLTDAPGGPPTIRVLNKGKSSSFAKLVEAAQSKHRSQLTPDAPTPSYKGVFIPGLNKQFLYYKDAEGKTMLVPLADDPELGLSLGVAVPASPMIDKLRNRVRTVSEQAAPG